MSRSEVALVRRPDVVPDGGVPFAAPHVAGAAAFRGRVEIDVDPDP